MAPILGKSISLKNNLKRTKGKKETTEKEKRRRKGRIIS
jgi:hypothetical protein